MSISLPTTIDIKNGKDNKAQIVIEPCYPGYGVTLGNSLRRVLLSSLEGTAITSFKVNGAVHEFSSIPNIKEDTVEIMLNLKSICLKSFSDEPVVLNIKVKGEKAVTTKDIEKNSDVEIFDTNQHICTITDKNTELDMELIVEKGHGYITVEERENEKVDIGTIMIDSIYSPVINVGFEIVNVRVGERTDYERLVLNVETDGSLKPEEALKQSADILVQQFLFISGEKSAKVEEKEDAGGEEDDSSVEKEEKEPSSAEASDDKEEKPSSVKTTEDKPKKKRGRPKKND